MRRRHSKATCLTVGIILGSRPCGRRKYNFSLIEEYKNAVLISTLDNNRDSEAARLRRTLMLLCGAASANASKKLELSWWFPWANKRALYLWILPSALKRRSKMTWLGTICDAGIVEISRGEVSKTFWEIKDLISFDKAKVHFSGVVDFEIK